MEAGRLGEADQMGVGLADELEAEADEAVAEDEGADELARLVAGARFPEHPDQDRHQHDALEQGLVKLARMARRAEYAMAVDQRFAEADRPGHVRHAAPELAVHEIGETAKEQAGRDAAGDVIVDPEPIELLAPGEVEDAAGDPD